ncbi:MAG: hypothetical protein EOM66_09595 [Clostridia bacterium]|nr:hypothetical protein [Clostridia bacterium]
MLGKKELQEMLSQRENALAQREAEIAVLTKRVEEITGREARLNTEVENYRARSTAIVNALTEAQQTASRIREEAERYKAQVVGGAYSERDAAKRQAAEMIEKARKQAEDILRGAQDQAANLRAQGDGYVADAKEKAASLKEHLRKVTEETQEHMGALSSFLMEMHESVEDTPVAPPMALPQNYKSPAELMRNIYTIQGRNLPEETPAAEEPQQTAQPQKTPGGPDLDSLLDDVMGAKASPKGQQTPPEEQVFSVNEILSSGTPTSEASSPSVGIPSGLDSIIDDILRGI